jgi:hypothetical protein
MAIWAGGWAAQRIVVDDPVTVPADPAPPAARPLQRRNDARNFLGSSTASCELACCPFALT